MRLKKKYIFLFLIIVIAAVGIYAYKLYNKPHRDVQATEAAFELDASELFNEFTNNESLATEKYAGQVIIVKGEVVSVLSTDTTANIFLKTDDEIFGVNCALLPEKLKQVEAVAKKDLVKIKGECQGFIDDVIVSKCAIIK